MVRTNYLKASMVLVAMTAAAAALLLAAGAATAAKVCDDRGNPNPPGGSAPYVSKCSPSNGSTTTDTTPTISAKVFDDKTNLKKKKIKLYVDGVQITDFTYNSKKDRLSYTPTTELALGEHEVEIVATDRQRNTTEESWSFEIVSD